MDPIAITLLLDSPQALRLFHLSGEFHDAGLAKVLTREGHELALTIEHPVWFGVAQKIEVGAVLKFNFKQPLFSQIWGSDLEICACIIYHFTVKGNVIDLQTGDGGRTGTFDLATSTVEIAAPRSVARIIGVIR